MPVDVRAFREGDEAAILDLFARSFPHAPRTHEHFEWKYRRDPYGNEHISLSFDEAQRLVGHYAAYCVPFWCDDRDVIAHQVGDSMTDVSVRHIGRGPTSVFGQTALHFYDTFCDGRIAFNYGFNVGNVQKLSLRFLRSDRVESVAYRWRDMKTLRPITRAERISRGYRLQLVREATPEFDELFARVAKDYRVLVRRDTRYLQWRHLDAPEGLSFVIAIRKLRRLVGWSAFRIREDRLTWGDALFDRRYSAAPEVLLRHVAPEYPVAAIEAWFPSRPAWFSSLLDAMHFERRPEPQDLSLMCVPFTMADATARMRESLYYTMADSDLF
jgi:hypothetical protein